MSTGTGSNPDQEPTWLTGRDILPSNLPQQAPPQQTWAPQGPPPRRTRRWSLIFGLPVLIIVCLFGGFFLGGMVTSGLSRSLPSLSLPNANANAANTGGGAATTASNLFNDPMVNEDIVTNVPPPKAPIAFLEAGSNQNGQAMWGLLSPRLQTALQQQGATPANFAQGVQIGSSTTPMKGITYVAGSKMSDGRVATIFVVTFTVNGVDQPIPYYFTVDTNGLIDEFH